MPSQNLSPEFVVAMIVWFMPILLLIIVMIATVAPVISRLKTRAILVSQAFLSSLVTRIADFLDNGKRYLD